ncbi:hypothetical protein [Paenibacillus sp. KN14-4R]|uniref:hypothetical protein n=1 Tax=Paenibacillus sp. KN14-4R TaxID=3445773 RepID=UPI003FA0318D
MFISKEQKEKITLLNNILGMKHRTRPFDFTKTEDIIEAVEFVTAEYVDMSRYWGMISELNSQFDESIECFYPAGWIGISQEGTTNDDELDEARDTINDTEDALRVLMDRSEIKCIEIWEFIFTTDQKAVKLHFFGQDITCEINILRELLEDEIFEIIDEIDYDGNIENSTMGFARNLLKKIQNKV